MFSIRFLVDEPGEANALVYQAADTPEVTLPRLVETE
jgi:hypothetical protein